MAKKKSRKKTTPKKSRHASHSKAKRRSNHISHKAKRAINRHKRSIRKLRSQYRSASNHESYDASNPTLSAARNEKYEREKKRLTSKIKHEKNSIKKLSKGKTRRRHKVHRKATHRHTIKAKLPKSVIKPIVGEKVHAAKGTPIDNPLAHKKKIRKQLHKIKLKKARSNSIKRELKNDKQIRKLKNQIKRANKRAWSYSDKATNIRQGEVKNSPGQVDNPVIDKAQNGGKERQADKYDKACRREQKRINKLKKKLAAAKKRAKKRGIDKFKKKYSKKHPPKKGPTKNKGKNRPTKNKGKNGPLKTGGGTKKNNGPRKGGKNAPSKGGSRGSRGSRGSKGSKGKSHGTYRKAAVASVGGASAGATISHASKSHGKNHKRRRKHVSISKARGKVSKGASFSGGGSSSTKPSKLRRKSTGKSTSVPTSASAGNTSASSSVSSPSINSVSTPNTGSTGYSDGTTYPGVDPALMSTGLETPSYEASNGYSPVPGYNPLTTGRITNTYGTNYGNGYNAGYANTANGLTQGSYNNGATSYPINSTGSYSNLMNQYPASQYPATNSVMTGNTSIAMLQQEIQTVQKEISQIVQYLTARQNTYAPSPQYNNNPQANGINLTPSNQTQINSVTNGLNVDSSGMSKDQEAVQNKPQGQMSADDALVASNSGDNSLQQMAQNNPSAMLTNAPQKQNSSQIQLGQ